MEIRYDPMSSFEDIATQVSLLEESVGLGDVPLVANETVLELQNSMQHRVAYAASELMTGIRWRREGREYLKTYDVYRQLLGAVALDIAGRTFDEDGDIGNVKQDVFGYLQQSKKQMVELDYKKRLEKSSIERSKQWLANHHKTRFALPVLLSGATTSALFKASEVSSSLVEITPAQGGLIGVMTLMGSLAIRSTLRTGPAQAGEALKKQFNTSLRTYMLERPAKKAKESNRSGIDNLPEKYAARHLTEPFGAAAIFLVNCNVDSKDDFAPMIDGLLDITEESMNESYGVEPDKEWVPLHRRWMGRFASAN